MVPTDTESNTTSCCLISARKNEPEWMLEWRLDAFRRWKTMTEPNWSRVNYPPIDYQDLLLLRRAEEGRLAEVARRGRSRRLLETYKKLGIPLREQEDPGRCRAGEPRRGRRGVRLGLGGDDLQEGAGAELA